MVDSLGTIDVTYDPLNRMISTSTLRQHRQYDYDFVGNRKTLTYPGGNVVTYTYDAADRMIGLSDWLEPEDELHVR